MSDVNGLGNRRWAIVGGGMLGLCVANRLSQAGQSVTVFEAAPQIGGLAASYQEGPVRWDRFYHVISPRDEALMGLLDEIGLTDEVRWQTTRTAFFANGVHHPLNNALDYLRLPVLGPVPKARFTFNLLYAAYVARGPSLGGITLETWLRRWSGDKAFEALWLPLVRAKLGANYKLASAAFIQSVIKRFYGARKGGARTEQFGFVEGGYARILERFTERLEGAGVRLETGRAIQAVRSANDGTGQYVVELAPDAGSQGKTQPDAFDRVVVTSASPIAAKLLTQTLPQAECEQFEDFVYQGVVCPAILLKRSLTPAYLTYLVDPQTPFTAVIEMTGLIGADALDGNALVYLPRYVTQDDEYLGMSDETVRSHCFAALARLYPHFREDDVVACEIGRARYVLPVPTLHYERRLPPIATSLPGLFVLNSTQILNAGLAVNEAVELAQARVTELLAA